MGLGCTDGITVYRWEVQSESSLFAKAVMNYPSIINSTGVKPEMAMKVSFG